MNIKTANRLCELRKQHNLSQEELAEKLGVTRQAISKWERSECSPDTDNLILLASIYNITIDELINGEDALEVINVNNKFEEIEVDDINVKINNELIIINNKEYDIKEIFDWNNKLNSYCSLITVITIFFMLFLYFTLGNVLENGYQNYWFLFILIPIPDSFVKMIIKKNLSELNMVCLVTGIYCAFGMIENFWHPGWIIFFIIPIYYIIADFIYKKNVNYKLVALKAYEIYKIKQFCLFFFKINN